MKKRIDALKRIGRLQALLHDLKRARLAAIEQERASLCDEIGAVFDALATGALAYGAQAGLGARHVRGLEQRIEALARDEEDARGQARAYGLRAKLAKEAAEAELQRYRDLEERKELVDLVGRAFARHRASPTQG